MRRTRDLVVVDASVAAKWHLPDEADGEQALALLRGYQEGTPNLVAPTHICYEVPAAITVATRGSGARLTPSQGALAVEAFLGLRLPTLHDAGMLRTAFALAGSLGIAYDDALDVALARNLNVPLVLADYRLYVRARTHVPCTWLRDWADEG